MTDSTTPIVNAPTMKAQLRSDLTTAMKARDSLTTGTLRMALTAITTAEVAGSSARELTDAEVLAVLTREMRKRTEAAEAFAGAGRAELAQQERDEAAVLAGYLPAALGDDELQRLVDTAVADAAAAAGQPPTMRQMGQVIKAVQAAAAGRADGARIAAAVKATLS